MIIFFIILTVFFLIEFFFLLLLLSNLEIEVKKLWVDSDNKKYERLKDYLFYIRLKIFDRITWFKIKIDKEKIAKIKKTKFFKKEMNKLNKTMNIKTLISEDNINVFKISYLKELYINIKQLYLDMKLSVLDNISTTFSVAFVSTIISIILAKNINGYDIDKYSYKIYPIYKQKTVLKVKLNCIIDIKIVHIINVIYKLVKKRSVDYDERTSNRRSYVCSNE